MNKAAKFEKQWEKQLGAAKKNPNSLWEQLEEIDPTPAAPPNSFTTGEYAEKRGISRRHALDKLNALAKNGKLVKHMIPGTHLCTYWTIA